MRNADALVLVGSAAAPLVVSQITSGSPVGATDMRPILAGASVVSGLLYLLTRSTTAGALALGTGGAWAIMKFGSGQPEWP